MSEKCRYAIVQFLPDIVRREPINVGIVLQSDKWIAWKFLGPPELKRLEKKTDTSLASELIKAFLYQWGETGPKTDSIEMFVPENHKREQVLFTDPGFLSYLSQAYNRQLQFSETRTGEVSLIGFDHFLVYLNSLYDTFVAPRLPKRELAEKISFGPRVHTRARRVFKDWGVADRIAENVEVMGTIPYVLDFEYQNTRKVLIATLELAVKDPLSKTERLVGQLADIDKAGQVGSFDPMIVFTRPSEDGAYAKSEKLVRAWAAYAYDLDHEEEAFSVKIKSDLGSVCPKLFGSF